MSHSFLSIPFKYLYLFTQVLTTLVLRLCQIGNEAVRHLADALRDNTVTIIFSFTILFTHSDFLYRHSPPSFSTEMKLETKEHNIWLLRYKLIGLALCSHHITHLQFFTQTLTTLELGTNQIGDRGAQHMAVVLQNNMVSLILSSYTQYISLHSFPQILTTLVLESNNITDDGVRHLADALQNNTVIFIFTPRRSCILICIFYVDSDGTRSVWK